MGSRHIAGNIIIACYGVITLTAFIYTLTRIRLLPASVWPLVDHSYSMMAPYQGDDEWNADLLAEGLRSDGRWESINLGPYFPQGRGEANVRAFLKGFWRREKGRWFARYSELARQLLLHERGRGRSIVSVRLTLERWPRAPESFGHLRAGPLVLRHVLAEVSL
ncbi:MAG: hypothetical protein Greene041619_895 [Candidatus Peregrinibacteria bacterium Greene0416_19]|nr:MAG: hypothetical protein Greene041619_895 [Candidatus Peregrinibacteria bacterium Greene0416_19]